MNPSRISLISNKTKYQNRMQLTKYKQASQFRSKENFINWLILCIRRSNHSLQPSKDYIMCGHYKTKLSQCGILNPLPKSLARGTTAGSRLSSSASSRRRSGLLYFLLSLSPDITTFTVITLVLSAALIGCTGDDSIIQPVDLSPIQSLKCKQSLVTLSLFAKIWDVSTCITL